MSGEWIKYFKYIAQNASYTYTCKTPVTVSPMSYGYYYQNIVVQRSPVTRAAFLHLASQKATGIILHEYYYLDRVRSSYNYRFLRVIENTLHVVHKKADFLGNGKVFEITYTFPTPYIFPSKLYHSFPINTSDTRQIRELDPLKGKILKNKTPSPSFAYFNNIFRNYIHRLWRLNNSIWHQFYNGPKQQNLKAISNLSTPSRFSLLGLSTSSSTCSHDIGRIVGKNMVKIGACMTLKQAPDALKTLKKNRNTETLHNSIEVKQNGCIPTILRSMHMEKGEIMNAFGRNKPEACRIRLEKLAAQTQSSQTTISSHLIGISAKLIMGAAISDKINSLTHRYAYGLSFVSDVHKAEMKFSEEQVVEKMVNLHVNPIHMAVGQCYHLLICRSTHQYKKDTIRNKIRRFKEYL
ncbi:hypothetical protein GQR58_017364 [Nymphon striatum]|nr:hypothetical protein GQR58_017364 [Nymphon striatum]